MPGGRPREFDEEKALERAMDVFWRRGYEGAGLAELTAAMGINKPSLYAAFGDKSQLFRKAVERYLAGPADYVRQALAAPTARDAVTRLLHGAVERMTGDEPHGCLLVHAAGGGTECDAMGKALAAHRAAGTAAIAKRLTAARNAGELPQHAAPAALARFLSTVLYGLSVQAAGGATRRELRAVADIAFDAVFATSS